MKTYYPEMNETRPEGQIEATVGSSYWYVKTTLEIKGRGITYLNTFKGRREYKVTMNAFKALKSKFDVVVPLSL